MIKTQEDSLIFSEFFDVLPQAIIWLQPVYSFDNSTIIDFRCMYSNTAGLQYFSTTRERLIDSFISDFPNITSEMRQALLKELPGVYATGIPSETEVYNPILNKHGKYCRIKFKGGLLTTIQDTTDETSAIIDLKQKTKELEHQEGVTERILNASQSGVFLLKALYKSNGDLSDFIIKRVNPAFSKLLNLPAETVINQSFLSIFPYTIDNGIFEQHCRVHNSGLAESNEFKYLFNNIDAWFLISTVKLDDGVLVTVNDITESKKISEQIETQKNLLDNLLENSSNGITVSQVFRDENGKVIDAQTILANEAAIKHSGLSRETLLSKTAFEIDPSFFNSLFYLNWSQTLETGISTRTEYFLELTGKWIEISSSKMDKDHLIAIFTDITSTKEAQLAIERSADQLQTIINKTQSGIFTIAAVKDSQGVVVDFTFDIVNRAVASYKNLAPANLTGQPVSNYFTSYKKNGLFDFFYSTLETGEINRFDFHYNDDGIDAWLDMMCTPTDNKILVTFTDYTPVKQLQLKLEKSVQELKLSNTNLEEFAYIASHDLQEPLRKIQTFSDKLKKDLDTVLTAENTNLFERIKSATVRMRSLIDDVLSYSRISSKTTGYKQVELDKLIKHILQDFETTLTETKAVVVTNSLPIVMGDESQLMQMFQNIFGNALKYRKAGTVPEISIKCTTIDDSNTIFIDNEKYRRGNYYLIEISDNGIGFEQEYAEKIFHVFQRLHGRAEYQGTGIGLSIVQKVITNHGGYILAKGEPGNGATFSIMFPI